MEKAKAAAKGFLSKDGKHDTTVHERVNEAVTNENVTRHQHEDVQQVTDREVHQDHYHTSVQPIAHKEVIPETHTHQVADVEHKHVKHGDDHHVKERLAAEAGQFKNTQTTGHTQHTTSAAPTMGGEHVHHHVHETIQPVINKETVQQHVVHTTIPVHEVHQNEAKHHTASTLPGVTMDQFKNQGGHIGGRGERTDAFMGEPRAVGGTLGGHGAQGTTSLTEQEGGRHGTHGSGMTGTTGTGTGTHGLGNQDTTGTHGTHGSGMTGSNTGTTGTGMGNTGTTTHTKPSLIDRMNPMKDTDGDGKKGFMK